MGKKQLRSGGVGCLALMQIGLWAEGLWAEVAGRLARVGVGVVGMNASADGTLGDRGHVSSCFQGTSSTCCPRHSPHPYSPGLAYGVAFRFSLRPIEGGTGVGGVCGELGLRTRLLQTAVGGLTCASRLCCILMLTGAAQQAGRVGVCASAHMCARLCVALLLVGEPV